MNGASARVLGMVRAHYARNESAFAYAATALATAAKSHAIRSEIEGLVRRGFQAGLAGPPPQRPAQVPASRPATGMLQLLSAVSVPDLLLDPELEACTDATDVGL